MSVICWLDECQHYNSGKCQLSEITIDSDGCEEYLSYSESKDYQTEYWKAVKTADKKKIGRASARGKLIQISGMDFFTESDDRLPEEQIFVTNAKTGFLAGNVLTVKKHWEELLEKIEKCKAVMDYPVCEYDDTKRNYVITEEGNK